MADQPKTVTVPLETPLTRAGGDLDKLTFRRPGGGDFRGLSMSAVGQVDYNELRKLLPRISMDNLIAQEIDKLDGADLLEVSSEVVDFLTPTRRRPGSPSA